MGTLTTVAAAAAEALPTWNQNTTIEAAAAAAGIAPDDPTVAVMLPFDEATEMEVENR
ncbi:hypothetical protein M569_09683 [Genlisea aurea]|uniref:Uncharacterized protein n=1 Tax=Genlisea aurea TaxID=192259 RepID=S8DPS9_9LAMI|nr:hypothetical protein M569_09683 [Genlisea aurea]